MPTEPTKKCAECDEPGPYDCHGIIPGPDGDFRGCAKTLCLAHIAGTAVIHFNPGGNRRVGYCAPCWEDRQRFIARRQAEIAARKEAEGGTTPDQARA